MMSFRILDLSVGCYVQEFTLWVYRALPTEPIRDRGYFDLARDMIKVGDVVMVTSSRWCEQFWVKSSGADGVELVTMCRASAFREC